MNKRPKRGGAGPGQVALDFSAEVNASVPEFRSPVVIVKIDEETSKNQMEQIRDLLQRFPGNRSVQIVVMMNNGDQVIMKSEIKVTDCAELRKALQELEG